MFPAKPTDPPSRLFVGPLFRRCVVSPASGTEKYSKAPSLILSLLALNAALLFSLFCMGADPNHTTNEA